MSLVHPDRCDDCGRVPSHDCGFSLRQGRAEERQHIVAWLRDKFDEDPDAWNTCGLLAHALELGLDRTPQAIQGDEQRKAKT